MVREVYDSYLNKKYEFHINNHSSILLRNMSYIDSIASIFMRLVSFYSDLILTFMAFFVVLFPHFVTLYIFRKNKLLRIPRKVWVPQTPP